MRALFKLFVAQASLLTVMLGIFVLRGTEPGPLNYDDPLILPVKVVRDQSSALYQTAQQKLLDTPLGQELANYLAKTDQALEPLLIQVKTYLENITQANSKEVEPAPTVVIETVEPKSAQVVTNVVSIEADQSSSFKNIDAVVSNSIPSDIDTKVEEIHENVSEKVSEKADEQSYEIANEKANKKPNEKIVEEVVQSEPLEQQAEQAVQQLEKPLVTLIQAAPTPISPKVEETPDSEEAPKEPSVQPTLFGSPVNDTTDLIERAFTSTVDKTDLEKAEQVDEVDRMEDLFGEDFVPQNVTATIIVDTAEPKVNSQPNQIVEAETPKPELLKVKKFKEEKPKIVLKKLEPNLASEKRSLAEVYATSMNQKQIDDVKQEPEQLLEQVDKIEKVKKVEPKVKQQSKIAKVTNTDIQSVVKPPKQPAPKPVVKADLKPVNTTVVKLKPARASDNQTETVETAKAKPELKKLIKITDSDAGPVTKYGFKIDEPSIEVDSQTDIPDSVFTIEPIPTF
jgi:hypothetical protein